MGCKKLTYQPQETTLKVAHSIFNNVKKTSAKEYLFGYQGSEKDNEVNSSNGSSYTTEFRQLDTRLGRWFSSDPVFQPWQSSYTSMDNNPVNLTDVLGDISDKGKIPPNKKRTVGKDTKNNTKKTPENKKDTKSDKGLEDAGWIEISEKEYDSTNPAHGLVWFVGGEVKYYKLAVSEIKFETQVAKSDNVDLVPILPKNIAPSKPQSFQAMPDYLVQKYNPASKENYTISNVFSDIGKALQNFENKAKGSSDNTFLQGTSEPWGFQGPPSFKEKDFIVGGSMILNIVSLGTGGYFMAIGTAGRLTYAGMIYSADDIAGRIIQSGLNSENDLRPIRVILGKTSELMIGNGKIIQGGYDIGGLIITFLGKGISLNDIAKMGGVKSINGGMTVVDLTVSQLNAILGLKDLGEKIKK